MAESYRYRFNARGLFRGILHRPGDVVEAEPHELGPHHEMIEGEHYPDHAKPPTLPTEERRVPLYSESDPGSTAYSPGLAALQRLGAGVKGRVEKLEAAREPERRR